MQQNVPTIDSVELVPPAHGRNLPPRAFTSPAIFDVEQRAIFARSWVHVADLTDLPNPGDYFAATIGRTPVIILRDRKTGELRAFLNACRHRGAQLLEGKGTCDKQIKCPYHAWSYGLDGKLLGVPFPAEFASLGFAEARSNAEGRCGVSIDADVHAMGLVPVRVGTIGPMILACLDPTAPDLDAWAGDLPAAITAAGAAAWQLAWELTYDVPANWKLFVENANDGYHIPFVHDVLTDALVADSGVTTLEPHSAYTYANINPAYVPPDRDPAEAKVRFGCIFPNLIPVLSPSDLTYIRVDPIAHDRLRLFVRSYDHPDFTQLREFRKFAFERTTDQDIAVVTRTMRGLHAEGLPAGVHASELEARIGHLERMWAEAMARDVAGSSNGKRLLAVAGR